MDLDPLANAIALAGLSYEHEIPIAGSHSDKTTQAMILLRALWEDRGHFYKAAATLPAACQRGVHKLP